MLPWLLVVARRLATDRFLEAPPPGPSPERDGGDDGLAQKRMRARVAWRQSAFAK